MKAQGNLTAFAKYAWFVLGYNVVVILWGVFLRASKSGDGCGQHWLTCGGEVIPSAPELKTVIEFSHRITSALDGLFVIVLVGWAIRRWYVNRDSLSLQLSKTAVGALVFVLIEGALGAGLVLTGNTAETLTPARPFWMGAHLINTLVLLTLLTMTAWAASTKRMIAFRGNPAHAKWIGMGVLLIFAVGITGSIAALSSMIFPSGTITEGITRDFSATSHTLLRLRPLHPIAAVASGVFLVFWSGRLKRDNAGSAAINRWATVLSALTIGQLAFGALTLLSLGPILMQLGHLLLADAIWITFILLSLNLLCLESAQDQPAARHSVPARTIASSES